MIVSRPWYITRRHLKAALDIKSTARENVQIDRAIESSCFAVDADLNRRFYPETAVRFFDWPNFQYAPPWKLWFEDEKGPDLVSVNQITSGGRIIPSNEFRLRPQDGPPFRNIELLIDTTATFGNSSFQNSIEIDGVWGHRDDELTQGELTAAIDDTTLTVAISDSSLIDVGSLIRVDSERMLVINNSMSTTGQTLAADLTSSAAETTVGVQNGSEFSANEIILIDAERMLITDVAANNLIVKRAFDGTTLAGHTAGATVFVLRQLTVQRAAVGTIAASHTLAAPVRLHVSPAPVRTYTAALALNTILQEQAGYSRSVGTGENETEAAGRGLIAARADARKAVGRNVKIGAI